MLTKIMKPIIAILRRIGIRFVIYLDDMLLMNQTKEGMKKDRDSLIWILHHLGWVINWKKSIMSPTQSLEFLGFLLDSSNTIVSLLKIKVNKLIKKNARTVYSQAKLHVQSKN